MSESVQIHLIWAVVCFTALTATASIIAVASYKYKELDKIK